MKAVLFDLDGTIVFSHPIHYEAYSRLFSEFEIEWNYGEFNSLFTGIGAPFIIKKILTDHGVAHFDLDELVRKKRNIFDDLVNTKPLATVPGFYDFLDKLKEQNMPRAIASGSHYDNIVAMIRNIGVLDQFPTLISAQDVPQPKPAPDVFLKAAEELEIDPADCLVIEDTTRGVFSAKAAGMHCIALTTTTYNPEKLRRAGADQIVEDYTHIQF